MLLSSTSRSLDLSSPRIMGILNLTPDSFSDGGHFVDRDAALRHALQMVKDGATLIDVGGESTRPGADAVAEQQELDRVIPVLELLRRELDCWISIDTNKAVVMQEAVRAGADLINDIRALREPNALRVAANSGAAVCLMHMQGQPRTMQQAPDYRDVTLEVVDFLQQRLRACDEAGIPRERICLDPGYGFGKRLEHNYELLGKVGQLHQLGLPLLVGMSRKSMLGQLLQRELDERLAGGLAAHLFALSQGAQILRVHDVKEMADAVRVWQQAAQYQG
ncbi:dihydropteroate synthase [Oceanisphaera psychrotolerans]|uniref:Dihydropteroate synthase n=1 Tax=Oceanisphaera psychrotolerans TaxID=1414654 RepID=A0A1J4QBX5_9GAMM|nr:dihydropteroate synthase [Oceanisphaera psychrotolerans]OIN07599.1 dihydropteroate synthase [Oceanisphaera psychrotolerans]